MKKYIIIFIVILCFSTILTSQINYPLTVVIENDNDIIRGYTFIDNVVEYNGKELKNFPKEKAINGVLGNGDQYGSLDVFVIGEANYAIFSCKGKKIINGKGIDIKVFENGFYTNYDKNLMSLDLGIVSVSKDKINWLDFPVSYDKNYPQNSSKGKKGFIGLNPVYINMNNNFIYPYFNEAGGDGFDLSDLGIAEGDYIKYIKLTDAGNNYLDGQIGSNGIDIDGLCVFYWKEN